MPRVESQGTLGIFFFFQAEDGIRDKLVTGVQTCALPIYLATVLLVPSLPYRTNSARRGTGCRRDRVFPRRAPHDGTGREPIFLCSGPSTTGAAGGPDGHHQGRRRPRRDQIGRASCRERV